MASGSEFTAVSLCVFHGDGGGPGQRWFSVWQLRIHWGPVYQMLYTDKYNIIACFLVFLYFLLLLFLYLFYSSRFCFLLSILCLFWCYYLLCVVQAGDEESHGILEGISSLHSWIKTQTMIRPTKLGKKKDDASFDDVSFLVVEAYICIVRMTMMTWWSACVLGIPKHARAWSGSTTRRASTCPSS